MLQRSGKGRRVNLLAIGEQHLRPLHVARRHPAMMPLLVHLTANEESTNKSPVP